MISVIKIVHSPAKKKHIVGQVSKIHHVFWYFRQGNWDVDSNSRTDLRVSGNGVYGICHSQKWLENGEKPEDLDGSNPQPMP